MTHQKHTPSYSFEFRSRGVRLFTEQRPDYSSDNAAYEAVASKLGCSHDSLRGRSRSGCPQYRRTTREGKARIKELEREVRELRQANEILKKVNRNFTAASPKQLRVSDFTCVSSWQGMVYVAFVVDVFARRIVGWRVSTSLATSFVLDTLNQAICQRVPSRASGLIHHSDRGSQYLSIKYTERLMEAGIAPSVGTVGDSYDNALAESIIGLF